MEAAAVLAGVFTIVIDNYRDYNYNNTLSMSNITIDIMILPGVLLSIISVDRVRTRTHVHLTLGTWESLYKQTTIYIYRCHHWNLKQSGAYKSWLHTVICARVSNLEHTSTERPFQVHHVTWKSQLYNNVAINTTTQLARA